MAADVGVERLLYVSTAAVYGPGPFRDLPVNGAPLSPFSPASRTRALAEKFVRDAGGLVVRPHLVYGPGDRWFLPTLTRIVSRLDSIIDGGSAVLSVVDVDLLARSIYELSIEQQFRYGSTLHVNEPVPRTVIDLLEQHARETNWTLPQNSIPPRRRGESCCPAESRHAPDRHDQPRSLVPVETVLMAHGSLLPKYLSPNLFSPPYCSASAINRAYFAVTTGEQREL